MALRRTRRSSTGFGNLSEMPASGHNGCGNVVIAPHRACASDLLLAPPDLIDDECVAACKEA
jgi:hypothetical protein